MKTNFTFIIQRILFVLLFFAGLSGVNKISGKTSLSEAKSEKAVNFPKDKFNYSVNSANSDLKEFFTSKNNNPLKENYETYRIKSVSSLSSGVQISIGGPILVISSTSNPFSKYPEEILLAEGLNHYSTTDISELTKVLADQFKTILLGDIPISDPQLTILSDWVQSGGLLIALKPDFKLSTLLGLTPAGGTLVDKYILINTLSGPGKGLVDQSIQYHSAADLYNLNGATSIATLYSNASSATTFPAVTIKDVGENGGKAVAFTYDLARSIVYTRQGNPLWSGQDRDGQGPIRSNDLFYPDYVDLNKVAIPQADEQQRLLANIIIQNNKQPVPRFWYLPRGLKAAVVMTGDDHASGGTKARFNQYLQLSEDNSAEAVKDWRAIRGSSYIYPNTPITDAEAKNFQDLGFEIALHLNTSCGDFTPTSLALNLDSQLADFNSNFSSLSAPATNRTHCITFSDWATQPKLESERGIRLDANYYYWPGSWVQNRPGMFTGSGFPMKFADLDGSTIDNYQLVTQMTDESEQTFPFTIDQLLDKALGTEGYYGVFCANMHTDADFSDGSDKIIASAKARNVPVISAKQMLIWLDGRNSSSFDNLAWNGSQLGFSVSAAAGSYNLEGMLPINSGSSSITSILRNGLPITYRSEKIKGINYAIFQANTGQYQAIYELNELPEISITAPLEASEFPAPATVSIEATAQDVDGNIAKVEFYNGTSLLGEDLTNPYTFNWTNVEAGDYSITAVATDDKGGVTTSSAISIMVNTVCPCSVFKPSAAPTSNLFQENGAIQLGMKFRTSIDGYVNGVRFYKQEGHTGVNIGQLYTSDGNLLAQVTFGNETTSGWQEASFSNPIPVSSNTTYIISYHSSNGYYSANTPNFSSAIENGPIKGLANGEDGPNGIYLFSNTPGFPTSTYQGGNYWVDVVFDSEAGLSNTPPVVNLTSPETNSTFTAPAQIILNATATDADGIVGKVEFFNGAAKLGEDVDGVDGWNFVWNAVPTGNYSITAKATDDGGTAGTSEPVSIIVNTDTEKIVCPCTVFESNEAPVLPVFNEGQGIQLGMKFRTLVNGFISGVKFYKSAGHLGTNTGQLYSSSGILLAEAVFDNETESGWQEVLFASPVAIIANTTYIISYHSSDGYYSANNPDFSVAKVNGLIKGLANGEDGPNGTYLYSSTPGFPVNNFGVTNYWVDAVFIKETTPENAAPVVAITSPEEGATFTAPGTVNITASASDTDGIVQKVEFFNGTTKLGEDIDGSNGWNFSWIDVATGNYALNAKATDDKEALTTSAILNIIVKDPINVAPLVAITSPEEGATFTAPTTVNITASASDTDGTVQKVEFFNGTTKLGEDIDGSNGWNFSWIDVATGNYALNAKATDDKEAVTTSEILNIVVADPINAAPAVALTSPEEGAAFTAPATIAITASASDTDGIVTKVEFFSGTIKLGEDLDGIDGWSYDWNNTAAGNYSLTAVAIDNRGTATTSAPISVLVENLPLPVISSFSPGSGPVGALISIFGQNFSSVNRVNFGPATATIVSISDTKIEVLVPQVNGKLPSNVKITVTTAGGSNTNSNKFTITAGSVIANNSPSVSLTSPSNGSEFLAPASINLTATASDSDGSVSRVEFFTGATKLSEDLTAPYEFSWNDIPAGSYALTARAIDDKGAVSNSTIVNISVTSPTNNAPNVTIISPANNSNFSAPASVQISATASDSDGTVTKVEYFNGSSKLTEFLSSPYNFTWSNVPEGNYLITARATDNSGAISSTSVNIYVNIASVLNEPSNLIAQWVSKTQVNLNWIDNSSNETGFILERATKSDFSGKLDLISLPPNTINYQDRNLNSKQGGGVLFYRIKALNGTLFSLYSNVAEAASLNANTNATKSSATVSEAYSTTAESSMETISDERLVASPNPTSGHATIQFVLKEKAFYTLSIYTTQGAFLSNVSSGYSEGKTLHSLDFNGSHLSNGMYLLRLSYNDSFLTFRLIISK